MPPPFAAVYFDCDSTLSSIEGVDELLQHLAPELRADLAKLTEQAMNGTMPLAEIYETRLRRIAPHRDLLAQVGALYIERIVPDAHAVVQALQHLGKQVGVISGGLLTPVRHLAEHLGIASANTHAVPVLFTKNGDYVDFDRTSPLWRNGGKIDVLNALPQSHRPLAFVGDGVTDLETQGTADLFVGFGGVVQRAKVKAEAAVYVDGPSLAPVLSHVLNDAERRQLAAQPRFAALLSVAKR